MRPGFCGLGFEHKVNKGAAGRVNRGPPNATRIPLERLDRQAAEQLRPFAAVFVLPSGDLRSRQAAVRLHRVFGLEGVAHVADVN